MTKPDLEILVPFTQYGHRRCALFTWPHAEHLLSAVTSFNPFPAICRILFFECDVFFLGTAFSIPSHIPSSISGILSDIADGIPSAKVGMNGIESCLEYRVVNLDVLEGVAVARRGRKDDSIDRVVTCAAAIVNVGDQLPEILKIEEVDSLKVGRIDVLMQ